MVKVKAWYVWAYKSSTQSRIPNLSSRDLRRGPIKLFEDILCHLGQR